MSGWQLQGQFAVDEPFALAAEFDEVLDGAQFDAVLATKGSEVREPGHVAVGGQNLANNGRFLETRQSGQIDTSFGVSRPNEYAAIAGPQAGDVAFAPDQVIGCRPIVNRDLNRARPIECGSASSDAGAGVDIGRERRGLGIDITAGHWFQVQTVADGGRHRQTDEASGMVQHEVYALGSDFLGGDYKVALILAVLVIHEHNHSAGAQFVEGFFDGAKVFGMLGHACLAVWESLDRESGSWPLFAGAEEIVFSIWAYSFRRCYSSTHKLITPHPQPSPRVLGQASKDASPLM
jgi:hypothetical protein